MEKLKIDGDRLKAALISRGETLSSASLGIGLNKTYLSFRIREGDLPVGAYNYLHNKYGISYEEIRPMAPTPDVITAGKKPDYIEKGLNELLPNNDGALTVFDWEELVSAIFAGVYGALIKAKEDGIL